MSGQSINNNLGLKVGAIFVSTRYPPKTLVMWSTRPTCTNLLQQKGC